MPNGRHTPQGVQRACCSLKGADQATAEGLLGPTSLANPSMFTHLACIVEDEIRLVDGSRLGVYKCKGATNIGAAGVEGAAEDADEGVVLEQGSPLLQTRGRHFRRSALTDSPKLLGRTPLLLQTSRKHSTATAWGSPENPCGVLSQSPRAQYPCQAQLALRLLPAAGGTPGRHTAPLHKAALDIALQAVQGASPGRQTRSQSCTLSQRFGSSWSRRCHRTRPS